MSNKIKVAGYMLFYIWAVALIGICFATSIQIPMWVFASITLMGLVPYALIYGADKRVNKKGLLLEITLIAWLVIVGFAFVSAALERGTTITHYSSTVHFE